MQTMPFSDINNCREISSDQKNQFSKCAVVNCNKKTFKSHKCKIHCKGENNCKLPS
jgi:hypothetical protein